MDVASSETLVYTHKTTRRNNKEVVLNLEPNSKPSLGLEVQNKSRYLQITPEIINPFICLRILGRSIGPSQDLYSEYNRMQKNSNTQPRQITSYTTC